MIEYRGRLDGPLSTAPEGLADAVNRARHHRVVAVAVCRNGHPMVTVLDTSMGRVAIWRPASRSVTPETGRTALTGSEWVATFSPDPPLVTRPRCRCTTHRGVVDVLALVEQANGRRHRRVRVEGVAGR